MKLSAALMVLFASLTPGLMAQQSEVKFVADTLVVQAEGRFEADPDLAVLAFDVSAQEKELKAAYAKASRVLPESQIWTRWLLRNQVQVAACLHASDQQLTCQRLRCNPGKSPSPQPCSAYLGLKDDVNMRGSLVSASTSLWHQSVPPPAAAALAVLPAEEGGKVPPSFPFCHRFQRSWTNWSS